MTAFDYSRPLATANRLIQRYGQTASLQRPNVSGAAYNPTIGAPTAHPCTFVELKRELCEVEGERVKKTKITGLLAVGSLTVEPKLSDTLVLDSTVEHAITDVQPLRPGGTVVLYGLEIMR